MQNRDSKKCFLFISREISMKFSNFIVHGRTISKHICLSSIKIVSFIIMFKERRMS